MEIYNRAYTNANRLELNGILMEPWGKRQETDIGSNGTADEGKPTSREEVKLNGSQGFCSH